MCHQDLDLYFIFTCTDRHWKSVRLIHSAQSQDGALSYLPYPGRYILALINVTKTTAVKFKISLL